MSNRLPVDHLGTQVGESVSPTNAEFGSQSAAVSKPRESVSQWNVVLLLLLALSAGILMASKASGQAAFPFDSVEMPEALKDEKVVRQVEGVVRTYVTTGNGNQQMVNGYFKVYLPAKMTSPEGVKDISAASRDAASFLVRAQRSSNQQIARQVSVYLYEGMRGVAEGNYHPAARINAILLLSKLDQQSANPAAKTAPVPLPQALPILLSLYQNVDNTDGVRAAALHGIHRHVRFGFPQITPENKTAITQSMNDLLTSSAPAGRNQKAHAYLQRFAVDIIDTLRPAADNSLGTQLISISTEPDQPDLIALYSASRFGSFGPAMQGNGPEPTKVLNSWGHRVLDAFESEIQRYDMMEKANADPTQPVPPESFLEKKTSESANPRSGAGGGEMGMEMEGMMGDDEGMMDMMGRDGSGMEMEMGDMGMGDMEMGMGDMGMGYGRGGAPPEKPQPPEVISTRKKLNYVLQLVHLGVSGHPSAGIPSQAPGGLLASSTPEQKPLVERWLTDVEGVVTVLNDTSLDDMTKFREGLEGQILVLRALVGEDVVGVPAGDQGLPDQLTPVDPLADLAPNTDPAVGNPAVGNPASGGAVGTVSADPDGLEN